jgi:carboxymethylenebutenolidase
MSATTKERHGRVNEDRLQIPTADGPMETFVAFPEGGPSPVVVIYMDAPGIREELYDFARRIAGEGYYCVLPDLYHRRGRIRLDLASLDEEGYKEMFAHMNSLTNALVLSDTVALLAALEKEPDAASGPKGCIGYCMSGRYVMTVAGELPDEFRASVSCYGVGIVTDDDTSPHLLTPNVQGEMFFAFAEDDAYVPDDVIPTLTRSLEQAEVNHSVDTYPGTTHGFCFPQRGGAYAEDAAEDVWRRTFEIFSRQLG